MATAVKTKEKITMLPLASIINKFDVRTVLDQDRVIQFAGIYKSDPDLLPPVRVVRIGDEDDGKFAYIDGRTRGAARAYLNLPDVPAVICNGTLRDNPLELFAEALELNWGGAKPPTRDDIAHTIQRMLELGINQKAIREPGNIRLRRRGRQEAQPTPGAKYRKMGAFSAGLERHDPGAIPHGWHPEGVDPNKKGAMQAEERRR